VTPGQQRPDDQVVPASGPSHWLAPDINHPEEDCHERPSGTQVTWGLWELIGVLVLVGALAAMLRTADHWLPLPSAERHVLELAAFELGLLILTALASLGPLRLSWASLGFRRYAHRDRAVSSVTALASLAVVLLMRAGTARFHALDLGLSLAPTPAIVPLRPLTMVLFGLTICVLVPIAEELFFRGYLYQGLAGRQITVCVAGRTIQVRCSVWLASLISGVAFGAAHLQVGVLIPFSIIGILFAWAYRRSGSLWSPILAHAWFNVFGFLPYAAATVAALVIHSR
jgi:membrane protease YdiL (CAAX protease family)